MDNNKDYSFQKGDYIGFVGDLFCVRENYGSSGVVSEVSLDGLVDKDRYDFFWNFGGDKCELIVSRGELQESDNADFLLKERIGQYVATNHKQNWDTYGPE